MERLLGSYSSIHTSMLSFLLCGRYNVAMMISCSILATALAVCLHGMAGDAARAQYGTYGTTASRALAQLGEVFRQLEGP